MFLRRWLNLVAVATACNNFSLMVSRKRMSEAANILSIIKKEGCEW